MNEAIDLFYKRRSVRQYAPKPVPKDVLQKIIDAGNAAPSGCNAQDWRFVVVEDNAFRQKLASLALPRYKKWMEKAPPEFKARREQVDASCADPIYYSAPAVVFIIGRGMTGPLDCPMVCENMMLAARSLGVGSCWVFFGQLVLDVQEVRAALELKDDEKVYGPILLGYPQGDFPEPPPKKAPVIKWI